MAVSGSGSQPGEVLLGSVAHGGFPARRLTRCNYDGKDGTPYNSSLSKPSCLLTLHTWTAE